MGQSAPSRMLSVCLASLGPDLQCQISTFVTPRVLVQSFATSKHWRLIWISNVRVWNYYDNLYFHTQKGILTRMLGNVVLSLPVMPWYKYYRGAHNHLKLFAVLAKKPKPYDSFRGKWILSNRHLRNCFRVGVKNIISSQKMYMQVKPEYRNFEIIDLHNNAIKLSRLVENLIEREDYNEADETVNVILKLLSSSS